MTDKYTPTWADLEGLWIRHHIANSPDMKHDPDNSEAGDGFFEFRKAHDRKVTARAWDQGYWAGINGHTGTGNPYREPNVVRLRENEGK